MSRMSKIENVPYNPKQYTGICNYCGHTNVIYDWDNSMKTGAFGEMYCKYCGHITMHSNIKVS